MEVLCPVSILGHRQGENKQQAVNVRGFRASVNPRFEAGIPDFMNGILDFSIHFNVVHRKVDWRNPKMKSLNSMPQTVIRVLSLSGGFTPCRHLRPSSGREHTIV